MATKQKLRQMWFRADAATERRIEALARTYPVTPHRSEVIREAVARGLAELERLASGTRTPAARA